MAKIKRTNEEWISLIEEHRMSGDALKKWCHAHGIRYSTMVDRISRLRKLGILQNPVEEKSIANNWVEVKEGLTPLAEGLPEIRIKIDVLTLTVNAAFPPKALANVCRELINLC